MSAPALKPTHAHRSRRAFLWPTWRRRPSLAVGTGAAGDGRPVARECNRLGRAACRGVGGDRATSSPGGGRGGTAACSSRRGGCPHRDDLGGECHGQGPAPGGASAARGRTAAERRAAARAARPLQLQQLRWRLDPLRVSAFGPRARAAVDCEGRPGARPADSAARRTGARPRQRVRGAHAGRDGHAGARWRALPEVRGGRCLRADRPGAAQHQSGAPERRSRSGRDLPSRAGPRRTVRRRQRTSRTALVQRGLRRVRFRGELFRPAAHAVDRNAREQPDPTTEARSNLPGKRGRRLGGVRGVR